MNGVERQEPPAFRRGEDVTPREVSVIIPTACIDLRGHLFKALAAFYDKVNQSDIREVLVIADYAGVQTHDELFELGDAYPVKLIMSPVRQGIAKAFNRGILESSGRYCAFMEDAIYALDDWVGTLLRVLEAHPHYGWVGCRQKENPLASFTSMASLTSKRAVKVKVGLLDERFICGHDDADLMMRFLALGYHPHGVKDAVVSHPVSSTTMTPLHREKEIEIKAQCWELFRKKHGIADFDWAGVPQH